MASETTERYDIAFAGECLEGHDPAAVRAAMGALFKADDATLERLFSGTRQRIKRNCDKATALKYQKSLAAAGAKAIITLAKAETSQPAPAMPNTAPAQAQEQQAGTEKLEILPGGSDILRPDERVQHEELALDLGHISVAETGERLSEARTDLNQVVDVPDFDVAEPGAQLGPESAKNAVDTPDTSALDLAPVGENLAAKEIEAKPSVSVDIEHLNLAEAGSALLTADERPISDAQAPDTSHLTLDPSENHS